MIEKIIKPRRAIMKREEILKANQAGISSDCYESYRTPVLQIAFDLGQKNIDLATQPVVTG
jgi:hypothetical protein